MQLAILILGAAIALLLIVAGLGVWIAISRWAETNQILQDIRTELEMARGI